PVGGGLHEGQDHGMRLSGLGAQLRLEEGSDEEPVGGRFNGADFALRATRDYGETCFHGGPFVFWIDFEVAEELFGYPLGKARRYDPGRRRIAAWPESFGFLP